MITILRKPEDAIASWLTKIKEEDIDGNLDWYNRFAKASIDRFYEILVLEFDEVVLDINTSISKCQDFFGLEKPLYVDDLSIIKRIKLEQPDRYSNNKNVSLIEKIKESKNYKDSLDYYYQVKSLIDSRKR
jgi:hypothetical protein